MALAKVNIWRLVESARYLPRSVRLLGTRYRPLFLAHARQCTVEGDDSAVADAMAFAEFMLKQDRLALMPPEQIALRRDSKILRKHFRLKRDGATLQAVRRWKIMAWLPF